MNKSDLVQSIAHSADISKSSAERALDAVTASIKKSLAEGESVSLLGFGTFSVKDRAARNGRNPQTGETIKIAASKAVAFKAGSKLKEAVQ